MHLQLLSALALISLSVAKTITIDVGQDGIVFSPENSTAAVNDILSFHFYSAVGPHSVVNGNFDDPCKPKDGAFFSGILQGTSDGEGSGAVFEVQVKDTEPIWFYCSARQHCKNGMVGVINPPSADPSQNITAYALAAKGVGAASAPSSPTGGYTSSASSGASSTAAPSSTSGGSGAASSVMSSASSVASSASSVASSAASAASSAAAPTKTGAAGRNEVGSGMMGAVVVGVMAIL